MAWDNVLDVIYNTEPAIELTPFEYDMRFEERDASGSAVRVIEERSTVWTTSREAATRLVARLPPSADAPMPKAPERDRRIIQNNS